MLVLVLTVLSIWCLTGVVAHCKPGIVETATRIGADIAGPTEMVFDAVEKPFSVLSLPWLVGVLLFVVGAALRRSRDSGVAVVALMLAPVAPVAVLALAMWAILYPLFEIAGAIK